MTILNLTNVGVFQRCSLLIVVLFIAVGLFMFTFESTQFNAVGFTLVLLASFISGMRWTLAQIVLQRSETGGSVIITIL
jgi:solute carrier family 35 protein C2